MNLLAHYLFPHESNNHKAKIIRPSGLSLLLVGILIFQFVLRGFGYVNPQILGYAANISPDEVIRLTNEKRAQNGLPPLTANGTLSQAAQAKAAHMLQNDYWAHVAPDGTQPWKFFNDAGYRYKFAGENLARDFSNPSSAVDAWMASPTHRDNLLSNKYKEIGIAVIEGDMAGVDTTIVVQLFGTRLGDTLPVQPVAAANEAGSSGQFATTSPTRVPTPKPTLTPTEVPVVAEVSPSPVDVLPATNSTPIPTPQVLISPFNVTKTTSGIIIGVLLAVLVIDMLVISRKRIARVSSRSLAHFAFFAMILAIVIIARAGKVL